MSGDSWSVSETEESQSPRVLVLRDSRAVCPRKNPGFCSTNSSAKLYWLARLLTVKTRVSSVCLSCPGGFSSCCICTPEREPSFSLRRRLVSPADKFYSDFH
jgi:hypothetical protein